MARSSAVRGAVPVQVQSGGKQQPLPSSAPKTMSDPLLNAGFTRQQVADALEFCDNDRERVRAG
jgi:hypothetical protein